MWIQQNPSFKSIYILTLINHIWNNFLLSTLIRSIELQFLKINIGIVKILLNIYKNKIKKN